MIIRKRFWLVVVSYLAVPLFPKLLAQLNLLTVQEAESLVEFVPDVRVARSGGRCPAFSVGFADDFRLVVQVRGACPDPESESTLISNYSVDLRTGVITEGDNSAPISTPEIRQRRTSLLKIAHSRSLSESEAACLVLATLKGEHSIRDTSSSLSVTQVGGADGQQLHFAGLHRLTDLHVIASGFYTVDLVTGRVRDDGSGVYVASDTQGLLLSKLQTLHFPLLLSTAQAIEIARHVPIIAERLGDGCVDAQSSGLGLSEEVYVGTLNHCNTGGRSVGALVSVNVRTGAVSDPKTMEDLSSSESRRVADALLRDMDVQLRGLQSEAESECARK
jgi:hypothetical protein